MATPLRPTDFGPARFARKRQRGSVSTPALRRLVAASRNPVAAAVAVLAFAISSIVAPARAGRAASAERPNIVIILADDLGYNDVSFHGGEIRTPNIDRLARQGVELSRFYVCPVCSPTRAGLMTGRYPIRFGLMRTVVPPWRKGGLDTTEVTLADVLAKAGYTHRGIFGKWHLGHSSIKYHPLRRGFTEFVGHYNGAIDYFTHEREGELDWHHNYESSDEPGYSTDLIAAAAAHFIEDSAKTDAPFFCYVPFNAPHSPFQAKPEHVAPYSHLEAIDVRLPPSLARGNDRREVRRRNRRILAGMISSLDEGVGRVLRAIDDAGVAQNTLVLFFSDNGGVRGIGSNYPLNGAKATAFEGGIRVVAAARWPAAIPGRRTVSAPLAYIDVLPTVMRVAGVEDHGGKPLDGIDMLDVLTGTESELEREIYSYIGAAGEDTEQVTVITPQWKLIVVGRKLSDTTANDATRQKFLYRIDRDPNETENLAADHPEVVNQLTQKLTTFRGLQPRSAVGPYAEGREGFVAPKQWSFPDG